MGAPIDQRFAFPKVAAAAGINYDTLKRWALRGHLIMKKEDREAMGQGGRRFLSYHTMAQTIVMAALARQGVPLEDASCAGAKFGHSGCDDRNPGELFKGGATVVTYNVESPIKSRVLRVAKDDNFLQVLGDTWPNRGSMVTSAVFANVQMLLLNAASALEMDRGWIMETLED